jgi:hypothetical protein
MQDFLHNIFSRGSYGRTDSPVVSVGGISSNSATLTYDVLHFDATGNLLINAAIGGGGGGSVSQSGSWTVVVSAGTVTALAIWTQRLDATNDAITVYQNVTNSNWSVIASQSGNWTTAISGGTMTVAALVAGTVSQLLAGTVTVTSVLSGTMSTFLVGQARTTDPAPAFADGTRAPIITDSLGKVVVLPGAAGDQHVDGAVQVAGVLSTTLIAAVGIGRRIAVQSVLATGSGSQIVKVILQGGPNNRTFGFVSPTGGFSLNAGGAPLYITSASTALSVAGDVTSTFNIFVSGYAMSN